ncbi:MAG: class I tRNA ligase family protein, partial [bacterium]|nr:class I tRNA ligase family protein [bacterium]
HIEQRYAPTIWDVDFETSVAQAELEDRVKQTAFYYIRFQLISSADTISIATTRPELLPACVGVTAHPEDSRYRHMFGKEAVTPLFGVSVPIFPSKEADQEKGTGIVMVCTFGDAADIEWWQREKLPLRQVLNSQGRFKDITFGSEDWQSANPDVANRYYSDLTGTTVLTARETIIRQLSEPDLSDPDNAVPLEKTGKPEPHTAKYYEKGKKPVEYLATRQWFVKILDKKKALIDAGQSISWFPEYMQERYSSWCQN